MTVKSRSTWRLLALLLGIASTSANACESSNRMQDFVEQNYPNEIAFDVLRNGKLVGEHVTRFENNEAELRVESRMTLDIKVLFLTVYEFEYRSKATWCGSGLQSLEASTNRNGEETIVGAVVNGQGVEIFSDAGKYSAPAEILTTDHWNPAVLERKEVLNTITGRVNKVEIGACQIGTKSVEQAAPGAQCYEYRGELNTRVWYDKVGRWRGLEFEGDDGSTITYVCRACG
ncbi:MAG: DUF6134 family protein [Gammaproteobacteria bacterium]